MYVRCTRLISHKCVGRHGMDDIIESVALATSCPEPELRTDRPAQSMSEPQMEDSVTLTQAQLDEKLREAAHNATAAALAAAKKDIKKLQEAATKAYEEGKEEGLLGWLNTWCSQEATPPKYKVEFWTLGGANSRAQIAREWQLFNVRWADRWDQIPALVHDWERMGGMWIRSQLRIEEYECGENGVYSPANLRAPWQHGHRFRGHGLQAAKRKREPPA